MSNSATFSFLFRRWLSHICSVTRCWSFKLPEFCQKLPKKVTKDFSPSKTMCSNDPKVNKYLGYFCKNISQQELSKIAQSSHTAVICLCVCLWVLKLSLFLFLNDVVLLLKDTSMPNVSWCQAGDIGFNTERERERERERLQRTLL